MDEQFGRIYSDQIDVYLAMQSPGFTNRSSAAAEASMHARQDAVVMVQRAITSAIRSLDRELQVRQDAILFLVVNLTELVAVPLLSDSRIKDQNAIQDTLTEDAGTILRMAREYTEGDREISAAAILTAAARALPNLKLKDWRLWDRR